MPGERHRPPEAMLINCVAYENGRKLADIGVREISSTLARPGTFAWVALADVEDAELLEMQEDFDLPELAVEDARHGHQRPKIDEYGDVLFAVLHMIEPEGDELRVGEVSIFVGRNYVLSVRRGVKKGFQDVRQRCEREPELLRNGAGFVFYALMDAVVDRYFPVLDDLEAELELIESRIFRDTGRARSHIEALYGLKQKLMTVKHATGPLLEAVSKLHGGRVPAVCANMQDYFRDVYDHLIRLNQTLEATREMAVTAISVNLSLTTIQENEVTKRLAAYAALVAVPTMIAGIYGMNFRHMPELEWAFGYPLALGVMAAIDLYLFFRFRKAGWI